jgi:hypothetical protein
MAKLLYKVLILAVLLGSAFGAYRLLRFGSKSGPLPSLASAVSVATPGPSSTVEVLAPDGKATLTLRQKRAEGGFLWTASVRAGEGAEKEIFAKALPSGSSISVPFNTFSPDDKFVFLKEDVPDGVKYIVLSASGASLPKGSQSFEIVGLFAEKYPDYKVTDVTGWGGQTLIVVNTDKAGGGTGPSFWFDVTSASFIRLTNRFD